MEEIVIEYVDSLQSMITLPSSLQQITLCAYFHSLFETQRLTFLQNCWRFSIMLMIVFPYMGNTAGTVLRVVCTTLVIRTRWVVLPTKQRQRRHFSAIPVPWVLFACRWTIGHFIPSLLSFFPFLFAFLGLRSSMIVMCCSLRLRTSAAGWLISQRRYNLTRVCQ